MSATDGEEECLNFVEQLPDPTNSPVAVVIFTIVYVNIFVLGLVGNLSIVSLGSLKFSKRSKTASRSLNWSVVRSHAFSFSKSSNNLTQRHSDLANPAVCVPSNGAEYLHPEPGDQRRHRVPSLAALHARHEHLQELALRARHMPSIAVCSGADYVLEPPLILLVYFLFLK